MKKYLVMLVLATVMVVGNQAFARNDGQENGAGCVNNCGNQTTKNEPKGGNGGKGGAGVGLGVGLGVGIGAASAESSSRSIAGAAGIAGASANGTQSTSVNVDASQSNDYSGMYDEYVAPAFAPPLAATGDCMGSASAGGSGAAFGFALGKTYIDEGCNARMDSRHLWSMGLHDAALLRLCSQPAMADALNATKAGTCPEKEDTTRDVYPHYYE
jgi:hypothetical protein